MRDALIRAVSWVPIAAVLIGLVQLGVDWIAPRKVVIEVTTRCNQLSCTLLLPERRGMVKSVRLQLSESLDDWQLCVRGSCKAARTTNERGGVKVTIGTELAGEMIELRKSGARKEQLVSARVTYEWPGWHAIFNRACATLARW
jgi:hypothetical protein